MFGYLLFAPSLLIVFGVAFLGWPQEILFASIFPCGIPFTFGVFHVKGIKRLDPNREIYETIVDMFSAYPDDWKFKKELTKDKRLIGMRYMLHDKIEMSVDYRAGCEGNIRIWVTNPEDKSVVVYDPKRGYRAKFREKIRDLHQYQEMKTMVSVALFADEHRSSSDKARTALDDFRKRKGLEEGGGFIAASAKETTF